MLVTHFKKWTSCYCKVGVIAVLTMLLTTQSFAFSDTNYTAENVKSYIHYLRGPRSEIRFIRKVLGETPPSGILAYCKSDSSKCTPRDIINFLTNDENAFDLIVEVHDRFGYIISFSQSWLIWLRSKSPTSQYSEELWSIKEIQEMADVLSRLPKKFHHLRSIRGIYKVPHNENFLGLANRDSILPITEIFKGGLIMTPHHSPVLVIEEGAHPYSRFAL